MALAAPSVGSATTFSWGAGAAAARPWWAPQRVVPAVWLLRLLTLVPGVLAAPEVLALVNGDPRGADTLAATSADLLGNASFVFLLLMLAITPLHSMTGWRWHIVLRRDFGIAMCLFAVADLVVAAVFSGETFSGGLTARLVGKSFLLVGTLATLLCLPIVATSNRRAQRWLGRHWKSIQRVTYAVWALLLAHLALLFGFKQPFTGALYLSIGLVLTRLPFFRRWFVAARRAGRWRVTRLLLCAALVTGFGFGMSTFVKNTVSVGVQAFTLSPEED